MTPIITIITPTRGEETIFKLIKSINQQSIPWVHILVTDTSWMDKSLDPTKCFNEKKGDCIRYNINIPFYTKKGIAPGSALRSVALMAAQTEWITMADSDVWYEDNHLETMINHDKNWSYCKRKIWSPTTGEYIGVDNFESVGEESITPYKMVDGCSMAYKRPYGASAAYLYNMTENYDDDRLAYAHYKKYAGIPHKTNQATVNQICPLKLEPMFKRYCSRN